MFQNGFLGNKASFMLDFVVVALVLIVPILLYSLYVVKFQRNYRLHKTLQLLLGIVLLVAVGAFEIDLHLVQGGWEKVIAKHEPPLTTEQLGTVRTLLSVHLVFAVSTVFLWIATITLALRRFPCPPTPGPHSGVHKVLGWLSTVDITLTSVTGLIFYWFAFVAKW